jgi:hypothetical protein
MVLLWSQLSIRKAWPPQLTFPLFRDISSISVQLYAFSVLLEPPPTGSQGPQISYRFGLIARSDTRATVEATILESSIMGLDSHVSALRHKHTFPGRKINGV